MASRKKNKHSSNEQPLTTTRNINGITFTIDMDGNVRSRECGDLGHIEECIKVAETLSKLFGLGDS